jgi:sucrose phosphorylase
MRLRNTSKAFNGEIKINDTSKNEIDISWKNGNTFAHLKANLNTFRFSINYSEFDINKLMVF